MNLSKSSPRGMSLIKFNPIHKILFGQWNDNKIISFILSLRIFGMTAVQHRVDANKVDFLVHKALKCYATDNFMGGVDNMDKDKKIGGSYMANSMFKKMYPTAEIGVFYFMIVDGRQAWNMLKSILEDHFTLDNSHF